MTDIDSLQKIAQILFYAVGGTLAILTYIKAKNGLLNTVNTEYHKKVIERLHQLTDDLYKEFDYSSDAYWGNVNPTKQLFERINDEIRDQRDELEKDEDFLPGTPLVDKAVELWNMSMKYEADPFLPPIIRNEVVALFKGRMGSLTKAHMEITKLYIAALREGKYWDDLERSHLYFQNKINTLMSKDGYSIEQVQTKVNDIRIMVQYYFEDFNPVKRKSWWRSRLSEQSRSTNNKQHAQSKWFASTVFRRKDKTLNTQ